MWQTRVVVASHSELQKRDFTSPYIQYFRSAQGVKRKSKFEVKDLPQSGQDPELYSEYAVFWHQFPLVWWVRTFGLFHYRCFLDLADQFNETTFLSFDEIPYVIKNQSTALKNLKGYVVVGAPLDFSSKGMNCWEQFVSCHPDAEEDLSFACDLFLELTGLNASKLLKDTNYLYCRNIFLAPRNFTEEWNRVSRQIMLSFNNRGFSSKLLRPGGFILERLFSVYVMQYESSSKFKTKNFIYFN